MFNQNPTHVQTIIKYLKRTFGFNLFFLLSNSALMYCGRSPMVDENVDP